jgi:hypothetical protein
LFLHITTVAFTGEAKNEQPNPALAVAKYFTFFPIVVWVAVFAGPWIERSGWRYVAIAATLAVVHALIEMRHRAIVRENCEMFRPDEDDGANLFLVRLDLREYGETTKNSNENLHAALR